MKIQVTSKREGFRRGGRAWSETPTIVDEKDFTAVQLAQIKAEKLLTVIAEREAPANHPAGGKVKGE